MEQLTIIPIPWYIRYKKALGGALIGAFFVVFVALVYFSSSKQDILRFIPKDASVFATAHISGEVSQYPYFQKLHISPDARLSLAEFLHTTLDESVQYNFGFALLPVTSGNSEVIVFATNTKIDASHPFYATIQSLGYTAFAVTHGINSQNYLILAKDPLVIDQIKSVTTNQIAGLDTNLSVSVPRQKILVGEGFVYFDENGSELINKVTSLGIGATPFFAPKTYNLLFHLNPTGISAQTLQYHGTQKASYWNHEDIWMRQVAHITPLDALKYLSLDKNISQSAIESISQVDISTGKGAIMLAQITATNHSLVRDELLSFAKKLLQATYTKAYQQVLPDKSTIEVIAKNRDEITVDEGVVSYLDQDRISVEAQNSEVVVKRNIDTNEVALVEMDGCLVNPAGDWMVSKLPGTAEALIFDRMLLSTYPQGYPQFLLCFE